MSVRYDSVHILPSGRVLVSADGLFGLTDRQGNHLLHPKYEQLTDLNNGLIIIRPNGKYGVTDVNGVARIPVDFDYLLYYPLLERFIAVKQGKWQKIQ